MSSTYSPCFSFSSPNSLFSSTWEKPRIALSGVRSSCDMFARNSLLCRLTVSSSRYRRWSSSFIWLTRLPRSPSSSRLATSTWREKSPDAIPPSRPTTRWIGPMSDHERK